MGAISSVYGPITEILLLYPGRGENVTYSQIRARFQQLMRSFKGVKFYILAHYHPEIVAQINDQPNRSRLRVENFADGVRMVPIHADFPTHPANKDHLRQGRWAQDPFLILSGRRGNPVFLEPYYQFSGNRNIAEQISAAARWQILSTRYGIQGGNILVGDEYALIGKDTLIFNLHTYFPEAVDDPESERYIRHDLERLLGVGHVIWVGTEKPFRYKNERFRHLAPEISTEYLPSQPLFHLDLFITLNGRNHLGEEEILVASFEPEFLCVGDQSLRSDIEMLEESLREIRDFFASHHTQNPNLKFKVIEIPAVIVVDAHGLPRIYSYNNALVEHFEGQTRLFLPRYSDGSRLSDFFREAEECVIDRITLSSLIPVRPHLVSGGFFDLAPQYGSLHCLCKVLRRQQVTI
ncbi:MAG: hypothetical protein AAF998_01700 [Bacteroidota bacterium]